MLGGGNYTAAIANSGALVVNTTSPQTFGGVISGTGSLYQQNSSGITTLTGNNSYSGGTTLTAGTLEINNAGTSSGNSAIGTGPLTINGGAIDSNAGAVTLATSNAMTWNNSFTFISSNNLSFGAGAVTLSNSLAVTVNANTLTAGPISGSSYALTKAGNGNLTLGAAAIGPVILNGGTTTFGAGSSIGPVTFGGGNLTFADGASTTGDMTVNSSGAPLHGEFHPGDHFRRKSHRQLRGRLVPRRIRSRLCPQRERALGVGNDRHQQRRWQPRTLNVGNNNATSTFSGIINQTGNRGLSLYKVGSGTLTLNGTGANVQNYGAQFITTLQAGTLILAKNSAVALPGNVTVNGGTLQLAGTGGNQIADTAGVTLSGGVFDLGTLSETVGAVSINVAAGSGNTIQNGNLTGSSYAASNSGNAIVAANLLDSGSNSTLYMSGAGTLTLSGSNTYQGATTISSGVLQLSGSGVLGGGNYTNTISNNGTLTVNTSSNQTFGGAISGNGTLTQAGNSVLVLNASNTYTGATNVSGGSLVIGTAGVVGSTAISVGSGASLTNNSTVATTGGITGTSTLTVASSGAAFLNTANNYSGATSVTGTLQLAAANAVQNSAVTLNNGATLQLRNNSATSFNSNGAVSLQRTSSPTVTMDVNNNGSGSGNVLTLANGISYSGPTGGDLANTYTTTINITGSNGYTLALPAVAFGDGAFLR